MLDIRRPQFVMAAAFCTAMVNGVMFATIPLLAKNYLGASPGMLGWYGVALGAPYVCAALISGRLSDRLGRRRVLNLAYLLLLCGFALLPWMVGLARLFAPTMLIAMGHGTFWPVLEATMCDGQRPEQVRRATVRFNLCWMCGLVAGPVLGGLFFQANFLLSPLYCFAVVCGLLWLLNRPRTLEIVGWGSGEMPGPERAVSIEKRRFFVLLAFIANVTMFFTLGSYRALLPEFTTPRGMMGVQLGLLQSAVTFGMIGTNLLLSRWRGWIYSMRVLIGAEVMLMILLCAFCLSKSFAPLLLIAFLFGVPAGLTYFSSMYYGMEQSASRGAHGSNHEAVIGLGLTLGPLMGSWAISMSGFSRANLVVSMLAFGLVVALQLRLVALWRRRPGATGESVW